MFSCMSVVNSHSIILWPKQNSKRTRAYRFERAYETAKGMVFADIQKLKIKDTDELRQTCRDAKIDFVVSKKRFYAKP